AVVFGARSSDSPKHHVLVHLPQGQTWWVEVARCSHQARVNRHAFATTGLLAGLGDRLAVVDRLAACPAEADRFLAGWPELFPALRALEDEAQRAVLHWRAVELRQPRPVNVLPQLVQTQADRLALRIVFRQLAELQLETKELAAWVIAFVEPVGVDKTRDRVVRVGDDVTQETEVVTHEPSFHPVLTSSAPGPGKETG